VIFKIESLDLWLQQPYGRLVGSSPSSSFLIRALHPEQVKAVKWFIITPKLRWRESSIIERLKIRLNPNGLKTADGREKRLSAVTEMETASISLE
jgi:hypothetical protein